MKIVLVTLGVIGSMLVGIAAERRHGASADRLAQRLARLLLKVVLPIVVFFNIGGFHATAGSSAGLVFGYVGAVVSCAVAYLVGTRYLALKRPTLGAMMNLSFAGNTGYLGLPVCAALLGFHALRFAIAYDVLVSSPELLLGSFGIAAIYGTHGEDFRARLRAFFTRNPGLFAFVLGILAPSSLTPHVLVSASQVLAISVSLVGFFIVGVTLGSERTFRLRLPVGVAVICKLLIPPGCVALLSLLIGGVPTAYLLQAGIACGLYNIVVADAYGLDRSIVAPAVAWSSVIVVLLALVIGVVF